MPGAVQIKRHLEDAWRTGRLSHAYIISEGTAGERQDIADYIAELLLARVDRDGQEDASGTASASGSGARDEAVDEIRMKQLMSGTHPDLIRISHEKPMSISVDDIRGQLSDTIDIRPYETEHKLYIIDEAEKMTTQAQNAVLKTIEEPPEYASILLLTENPGVFLETIRSRCVCLKITSEEDKEAVPEEYLKILRGIAEPQVRSVLDSVAALKEDKTGIPALIEAARVWLRDVLVLKATGDEDALLLKSEAQNIMRCSRLLSMADIEHSLKALDEAESRIESNVNTELTLQLMFMELGRR